MPDALSPGHPGDPLPALLPPLLKLLSQGAPLPMLPSRPLFSVLICSFLLSFLCFCPVLSQPVPGPEGIGVDGEPAVPHLLDGGLHPQQQGPVQVLICQPAQLLHPSKSRLGSM